MPSRREFMRAGGGLLLVTGGAWAATHARAALPGPPGFSALPAGTVSAADLEALPGKVPLIKRTWHPPNFETPMAYFDQEFTPNRAFFVRYHLAEIPEIAADQWRLKIGGDATTTPFELNLEQLKRDYPMVELAAVAQCAGNRRGLFDPHVAGVQWGAGAIGNARWQGARLKDVLARAGLTRETLEISFDGADAPIIPATPDFQKSIPVWKALDENTLIAYQMNGEPLPHWNGFPARIVVPGWAACYWMKHVTSINALSKPFDNFWVKTAYRIPTNRFPIVEHFASQMTEANEPVTEILVNSLITNVTPGQAVAVGSAFEVRGLAWDGGRAIEGVEVSIDGGRSWRSATLGVDYGRFAFRSYSQVFTPVERGPMLVMARATSRAGATQPMDLIPNPAGYHHNAVQRLAINAV